MMFNGRKHHGIKHRFIVNRLVSCISSPQSTSSHQLLSPLSWSSSSSSSSASPSSSSASSSSSSSSPSSSSQPSPPFSFTAGGQYSGFVIRSAVKRPCYAMDHAKSTQKTRRKQQKPTTHTDRGCRLHRECIIGGNHAWITNQGRENKTKSTHVK